ncbi:MAG: hypothetical protein Q8T03_03650 [Bacteroidota bacterium]|nr:hypothetical protein [Bacteroidota bacterium]
MITSAIISQEYGIEIYSNLKFKEFKFHFVKTQYLISLKKVDK